MKPNKKKWDITWNWEKKKNKTPMNTGIRIVFLGTPDFAVASLKALNEAGIEIAGVITAPDKPAGRGKKLQSSAVKKYAVENNIGTIFQPPNLKDTTFQEKLKAVNADLFVVVAFRMLPDSIWSMPRLGSINLHASILPNYRGAAPINWAIINGEKKTGVTTFFIEKDIDTGKIIRQDEVKIEKSDSAGILHDKLMVSGAKLLVDTVRAIEAGVYEVIPQNVLITSKLKTAPKIFKEDCKIDWNKPAKEVYNFIRGLSPHPAAWTEITGNTVQPLQFKIFETSIDKKDNKGSAAPGIVTYANKNTMKISCADGDLLIHVLQQAGKKRMKTDAFLRGFSETHKYTLTT